MLYRKVDRTNVFLKGSVNLSDNIDEVKWHFTKPCRPLDDLIEIRARPFYGEFDATLIEPNDPAVVLFNIPQEQLDTSVREARERYPDIMFIIVNDEAIEEDVI